MQPQTTTESQPLTYPAAFMAREPKAPGTGWERRHNLALTEPSGPEERRLSHLLKTVAHLATALRDDGYGAPNVLLPILQGTRAYLNFDLGRMDGGTLDGALLSIAATCGLNLEA